MWVPRFFNVVTVVKKFVFCQLDFNLKMICKKMHFDSYHSCILQTIICLGSVKRCYVLLFYFGFTVIPYFCLNHELIDSWRCTWEILMCILHSCAQEYVGLKICACFNHGSILYRVFLSETGVPNAPKIAHCGNWQNELYIPVEIV